MRTTFRPATIKLVYLLQGWIYQIAVRTSAESVDLLNGVGLGT